MQSQTMQQTHPNNLAEFLRSQLSTKLCSFLKTCDFAPLFAICIDCSIALETSAHVWKTMLKVHYSKESLCMAYDLERLNKHPNWKKAFVRFTRYGMAIDPTPYWHTLQALRECNINYLLEFVCVTDPFNSDNNKALDNNEEHALCKLLALYGGDARFGNTITGAQHLKIATFIATKQKSHDPFCEDIFLCVYRALQKHHIYAFHWAVECGLFSVEHLTSLAELLVQMLPNEAASVHFRMAMVHGEQHQPEHKLARLLCAHTAHFNHGARSTFDLGPKADVLAELILIELFTSYADKGDLTNTTYFVERALMFGALNNGSFMRCLHIVRPAIQSLFFKFHAFDKVDAILFKCCEGDDITVVCDIAKTFLNHVLKMEPMQLMPCLQQLKSLEPYHLHLRDFFCVAYNLEGAFDKSVGVGIDTELFMKMSLRYMARSYASLNFLDDAKECLDKHGEIGKTMMLEWALFHLAIPNSNYFNVIRAKECLAIALQIQEEDLFNNQEDIFDYKATLATVRAKIDVAEGMQCL